MTDVKGIIFRYAVGVIAVLILAAQALLPGQHSEATSLAKVTATPGKITGSTAAKTSTASKPTASTRARTTATQQTLDAAKSAGSANPPQGVCQAAVIKALNTRPPRMPNVVGCNYQEIRSLFGQFKYTVVDPALYEANPLPRDSIFQTEPTEGTSLQPGSKITLHVSTGQAPPLQGQTGDISVTRTLHSKEPYSKNQKISYDINVSNLGPGRLRTVTIAEKPTNLKINEMTSKDTSVVCTISQCAINDLEPNQTKVISVWATIIADGTFGEVATAEVAAPDTDPNADNDTSRPENIGSTKTTPKKPEVDLQVTQDSDKNGPYESGKTVELTITVHNRGPSVATNINISDTPFNLIDLVPSGACESFPCTIDDLYPGMNATIKISATVGDKDTYFTNSVAVSSAESDTNRDNDKVTLHRQVTPGFPLWLLIAVAGLGGLGLAATAAAATHVIRVRKWKRLLDARASIALEGVPSVGSLSGQHAPIGVSVHVGVSRSVAGRINDVRSRPSKRRL